MCINEVRYYLRYSPAIAMHCIGDYTDSKIIFLMPLSREEEFIAIYKVLKDYISEREFIAIY